LVIDSGRPEIKVFTDHVFDLDEVVEPASSDDIVCILRERTRWQRLSSSAAESEADRIRRVPGCRIDLEAASRTASMSPYGLFPRLRDRVHTGPDPGDARNITVENASMRSGRLADRRRQRSEKERPSRARTRECRGGRVAEIGKAFGMRVIAWSPNLTSEEPQGQLVQSRSVSKG